MSQAQGYGAAAASLSLHDLPDPVICHMTSFLPRVALVQFSVLSRLMLQCSVRNDKMCRLIVPKHRRWDVIDVTRDDVLALRRRLSRGQGVCTHIHVEFGSMMELLDQAIRAEPELGRQVLTLEVGSGEYEPEGPAITLEELTGLLREDMFPSLRVLKVDLVEYTGIFDEEVEAFFDFLSEDACPKLEHLELSSMSYTMLAWVARALNGRGASCAHLKKLSLRLSLESFAEDEAPEEEIIAELLQAPCLSRLEHLYLDEARFQSLALPLYVEDESLVPHLTELSLCNMTSEEFDEEDGTELMLALAAGKAPNLRKLSCRRIIFEGRALRELCDAIAEAGVLQHLEDLSIIGFESVDDAFRLARAVGSGCPRLHAFKVDPKFQARALAALLRVSPHVALSENSLEIPGGLSFREVAEAVQHHRYGLPGLQKLSVSSMWSSGPLSYGAVEDGEPLEPEEVMPLLAGLLERCPNIGQLALWRLHAGSLATALAPGGVAATATRHLRELYVANTSDGVAGLDALLQSLAAGACPQLHALFACDHHQCNNPHDCNHITTHEMGSKAGQDALVALLSGQAPCSPTIHKLIIEGYRLDKEHVGQLTDAFRSSKAVCMEWFGGLVLQGGLSAYIEFLRALSGRTVGHRLHQLLLQFSDLTGDGFVLLDMAVARLIEKGAWPGMPRDDVPAALSTMMLRRERTSTSMDDGACGPVATMEALAQRRREREQLSRRRSAEGRSTTTKVGLFGIPIPSRV